MVQYNWSDRISQLFQKIESVYKISTLLEIPTHDQVSETDAWLRELEGIYFLIATT
jgi:hypothetical protein